MFLKASVLAVAGAMALSAAPTSATVFEYTGDYQSFTVPTTGIYKINSYGAQGGGAYGTTGLGGLGARVGGDFTLTQGDVLTILVGGMGAYGGDTGGLFPPALGGGGGGGSFVYTAIQGTFGIVKTASGNPTPATPTYVLANTFTGYVQLADAGGGGGIGPSGTFLGGDGQAVGTSQYFAGSGGFGSGGFAGAGAGYITPGVGGGGGNSPGGGGQGGQFPQNARLGPDNDAHGGFGGGGAGGTSSPSTGGQVGGGGGGGGYSGGNGQDGNVPSFGGYSYLADSTPMNADYVRLSGVRAGNGLVTIDFLSAVSAVPEPASWLSMIVGMGMIGLAMRRRHKISTSVKYA